MDEPCPICQRRFSARFIERHVNSCLDTLGAAEPESKLSPVATQEQSQKPQNVFAALGLKADSGKPATEKAKKGGATLTSILLAEKRLKRRQEELEQQIRQKQAKLEQSEQNSDHGSGHVTIPGGNRDGPVIPANKTDGCNPDQPSQNETKTIELTETDEGSLIGVESKLPHLSKMPYTQSQAIPNDAQNVKSYDAAKHKLRQEAMRLQREADLPLAQRLRPKTLDDFHGQEKLVGENGILRNLIEASQIPSFILWGVPGVGKTSLARIILHTSNHKFVEISGSDSNAKKLKEAFAQAQHERQLTGQKTILFLDEIHRFNKAVQDLLLPVIEKGTATVIGATTENPSFTLNNALLSRMHTFVMDPLPHSALVKILNRGLLLVNKTRKLVHGLHLIAMNKAAVDYIASISTGDSRVALNILESVDAYLSGLQFRAVTKTDANEKFDVLHKLGVIPVTLEKLQPLLRTRNFHQMYDKTGENHYDTISAFHKSVRGSNADAAVFYLVKMLRGGEDPLFIARRMIVIASEDIGLRDSSCLPFAIAAMEALQFVGMPEGEIVLAHCAVKLARAPKSTKSYRALRKAQALLSEKPEVTQLPIPMHLRNAPTKLMKELGYGDTYKYNPNFKHGLIKQDFLPALIGDVKFVEETHLGMALDVDVDAKEYTDLDAEEAEYASFKLQFRDKHADSLNQKRKSTRQHNALAFLGPLSSPVERLASYDENLSRHDQPEYFDGSEQESEKSDANLAADCTYDEFLKDI